MNERLEEWANSVMMATAVALVVLLPVQLLSWLIISDPTSHTTQWVADRWSTPAWRAVDWVFLVVALVHGGLGTTRWLSGDRAVGGWRTLASGFVLAVCVALVVLGSYTLFTFELT